MSCWAADRAVGRTIWAAASVTNAIYSRLRLHYGHHYLKNQSPMGGDSKTTKNVSFSKNYKYETIYNNRELLNFLFDYFW